MTHLSEDATYQTRDGSRKGVRVVPRPRCEPQNVYEWTASDGNGTWTSDGSFNQTSNHPLDLIKETRSTPPPFSFEACPVGKDGRKRAVTRDGREVVLLASVDHLKLPIYGFIVTEDECRSWYADGRHPFYDTCALLVPPPPKRIVWVNLYDLDEGDTASVAFESREMADHWHTGASGPRLGNRAYPIEIEGDAK